MLTKLKLKDFQSHKNTEFTFGAGLNVITAPSGTGKTAMFRALYYLFKNKPNNVKFQRRPDAKSFTIEAELDGHIFKRVKGDGVNSYQLDNKKWEDIGINIPQEAIEVANIKPIQFNEETSFDVHFSKQFDPHFLLFESGSNKSKFLNRISGSYIVDLAIKNVLSDINENNKQKEELQLKKGELQNQITYYSDIIQPFSVVLDKIKDKFNILKVSKERLDKLKSVYNDLLYCRKNIEKYRKQQSFFDKVNLEGFDFRFDRLSKLYNLNSEYKNTQQWLKYAQGSILGIERLQLPVLEGKIARYSNLVELKGGYNTTCQQIQSIQAQIDTLDKTIKETVDSYAKELEAQKICPTCGRNITKTCIDKIIKDIL